jgi:hypothetical protein
VERLERQMQHDAGVLANRIEHHRPFELGDDFAHDLDRLRFQAFEVLWKDAPGSAGVRRDEIHCNVPRASNPEFEGPFVGEFPCEGQQTSSRAGSDRAARRRPASEEEGRDDLVISMR